MASNLVHEDRAFVAYNGI